MSALDRLEALATEMWEKKPAGVDVSDYSNEFVAGFLAGQEHAVDELRVCALLRVARASERMLLFEAEGEGEPLTYGAELKVAMAVLVEETD